MNELDESGKNRPDSSYKPEKWGTEETAYFMLINCITKEEWDEIVPHVIALGVELDKIEGVAPNHRDTLPHDAEWCEYARVQRAELLSVLGRSG